MADSITMGPCTPDQHAGSTGGDQAHMPDGCIAQMSSLGPLPTGPLGTYKQSPIPAITGSQEITPREQYNFTSDGEPGLLGQDQDDYNSTLVDSQRPTNIPNVDLAGESGATHMEPQGSPLDWNAIGNYKYPEYPMSPARTAGGGRARVQDSN